ncbi:hypothetical protein FRC14_001399 [Serendipita sp. 396]|nr:hypothetical protein FRC14_001399 [Serendipita sp. 396]KAG8828440.1 hypothetical protein FRC19_006538 [Serendipita sp. 401]KAG9058084.1 hypothetical protein FS842_001665 [Serendipita sp. 407]
MSVALILGAGQRVGKAVASQLVTNGYKVALGSRSGTESGENGTIAVKVDVTKPEEVAAAFAKSERELGAPVSVVVYNTGAFSALPEKEEPFSLPYDKFVSDVTVGGTGAYFALQETISSFKKLPAETPKVFIATSNLLGVTPPVVNYMSLGLQKHTLAYLVQIGNKGYPDKGYRFYLATQVGEDGGHPGPEMSGEAHAIAYSNLIQRKERGGWDIRFIKDGSILTEN